MQTELIIVSEYCHKCHIEPSFIEMLEEGGLINVHTEGGVDAIHHLLERMEDMRHEMRSLRKQLLLYREREIEDMDW